MSDKKNSGYIALGVVVIVSVATFLIYEYQQGNCVLCKQIGLLSSKVRGVSPPTPTPIPITNSTLDCGTYVCPPSVLPAGNSTIPALPSNATVTDVVKQAQATAVQNSGVALTQASTQNITNAVTQAKASGASVAEQQSVATTLAAVSDLHPYLVTITEQLYDNHGNPAGTETFQVDVHAQSQALALQQAKSMYPHVISVS